METVIADLPLPADIDRRIFQRHYLGASTGYRSGAIPKGLSRPPISRGNLFERRAVRRADQRAISPKNETPPGGMSWELRI